MKASHLVLAVAGLLSCARQETGVISPATTSRTSMGEVIEEKVGAMTVLLKPLPGAELATVFLVAQGGSMGWNGEGPLPESVALHSVVWGGPEGAKEEFQARLAELGVRLRALPTRHHATIGALSPARSAPDAVRLVSAALLHPGLPAEDAKRAMELLAHDQARRAQAPEELVWKHLTRLQTSGHPDAKAALEALPGAPPGPEQLRRALGGLLQRSRLTLIAVGGIDPPELLAVVREAFRDVPDGAALPRAPPYALPAKGTLTAEARELPINYLGVGFFFEPIPDARTLAAAFMAKRLLNARLRRSLQGQLGIAYVPEVHLNWSAAGARLVITLGAADPNATLSAVYTEVRRLRDTRATEGELRALRQESALNALRRIETSEGIADALATSVLLGDPGFEAHMAEVMGFVTVDELRSFALKTLQHPQVVLVGKPEALDPNIARSL